MLFRILSGFDSKNYYLITKELDINRDKSNDNLYVLSARTFELGYIPYLYRLSRLSFGYLRDFINIVWPIIFKTKKLLKILDNNPVEILLACSGDITDIPAGFLASKIKRIRFIPYICDDFVFQWTGFYRLFARLAAAIIFRNSSGLIGLNEFICDEYRKRYGITATLVRPPFNPDELKYALYSQWPAEQGVIRIIFTGAIYRANYDCFRNLIQAIELIKDYKIELDIYTAQSEKELVNQGIRGNCVFVHSHVPYNQILEKQRKADILFLPLAFKSPIPEVLRTSAPAKTGEYLLSGRPVIAHVPDDSFVAYYMRKYESALVVSNNDAYVLKEAIEKLVFDHELRRKITTNARTLAQRDMTPENARNQFNQLLLSLSVRNIE